MVSYKLAFKFFVICYPDVSLIPEISILPLTYPQSCSFLFFSRFFPCLPYAVYCVVFQGFVRNLIFFWCFEFAHLVFVELVEIPFFCQTDFVFFCNPFLFFFWPIWLRSTRRPAFRLPLAGLYSIFKWNSVSASIHRMWELVKDFVVVKTTTFLTSGRTLTCCSLPLTYSLYSLGARNMANTSLSWTS